MTASKEEFRRRLQTELGLTIGPKDPILAEWVAQQEFLEEIGAEHQRLLAAFEQALVKSQAGWSESAKNLANQSLNAALGTAREKIAAFSEESGRRQAAPVRTSVEEGVERLEKIVATTSRIAWVSLAASVLALASSVGLLVTHLFR
jgi:hypothetical protein